MKKRKQKKENKKTILTSLLLIILLIISAKSGIFKEGEELEKSRANYSNIYGEKSQYFTFSK